MITRYLSKNLANHSTPNVRQLLVATCVQIAQALLVQSHQLQQRGVHISQRNFFVSGTDGKIIGRSKSASPSNAATCHPYDQAVLVMIASWLVGGEVVVKRRAT